MAKRVNGVVEALYIVYWQIIYDHTDCGRAEC